MGGIEIRPKFLQDLIGKTGNGWDNIEHLFDL